MFTTGFVCTNPYTSPVSQCGVLHKTIQIIFMKKFSTLLLFLLGVVFVPTTFAQMQVTGTVIDDATDLSIPGVQVVVHGTTTGTTTDVDGMYSISVPSVGSILEFSFV